MSLTPLLVDEDTFDSNVEHRASIGDLLAVEGRLCLPVKIKAKRISIMKEKLND